MRTVLGGRVDDVRVHAGDTVAEGDLLLTVRRPEVAGAAPGADADADAARPASAPVAATSVRPDLRELRDTRSPACRRRAGPRRSAAAMPSASSTARENVADLCDAGSFIEYGALAFAAQRAPPQPRRPDPRHARRRHGHRHRQRQRRAVRRRARPRVVLAYDATVLAGTQGMRNHQKTDRMLGIAARAAAAGRALRRGRRRPAGRCRHAGRRRTARADLRQLCRA